ncbi:lipocalin family protein [Petrachloros mirabilis]
MTTFLVGDVFEEWRAMLFHRIPLGIVTAILVCLMTGCAGTGLKTPPETVTAVDLARYTGLWHEIARLPMWAQRNCVTSTAEYRLRDDGKVGVRNACVTKDGGQISIDGEATVVDAEHHAKLNVVFDQWAAKLVAWFTSSEQGNYWILRLDPNYQWVVVGTPDREYLWILSRSKVMDDDLYRQLVEYVRQQGFPVDKLIRAPLTAKAPFPTYVPYAQG